jgi:hypothetical protein
LAASDDDMSAAEIKNLNDRIFVVRVREVVRSPMRSFRVWLEGSPSGIIVLSVRRWLAEESMTMANLEVTKVEEQKSGRFLFNVRVVGAEGRMDVPIAIQDRGSSALDEAAVLKSTLGFAEDLAASVRMRLGVESHNP